MAGHYHVGRTCGPIDRSHRPDSGPLELASTETVNHETIDPAGLDRATWWLAHADIILSVDDISGPEATTSLSTAEFCHDCPIVLYAIDKRGTVTVEPLRTPQLTCDREYNPSIPHTNAPVEPATTSKSSRTSLTTQATNSLRNSSAATPPATRGP